MAFNDLKIELQRTGKANSENEKLFDQQFFKIAYEINGVGFKYIDENKFNGILFIDNKPEKPYKEKLKACKEDMKNNFHIYGADKVRKYLAKIDTEDVCSYIHPL